MKFSKHSVIILFVLLITALEVVGTNNPSMKYNSVNTYINLKVLPKNISSKKLQEIMTDEFNDGLGVSCGFCHSEAKDGRGLDFAADDKPEKEIARSMIRMSLGINKKYFKIKQPIIGDNSLVVTCNTCHKGLPFPDEKAEQK